MLGGVVQYVAQHLLQPFRIAGDRIGVQFAVVVILQTDAVLSEQLLIGVNGVLKLRLQVHVLDAEGKTTVLHLGELQQLLHHVGEPAGFLEDNVQTPAQLSGIVVLQQCLAPTIDGRQGGAQLVGHGGDELRLDLLTLADFQGHIVDVVHQLPHLIGVGVGQLDAVAAAGDALGGVRHLSHRGHHAVDEQQTGDQHQTDDPGDDGADDEDGQKDLMVDLPGGGDIAHKGHRGAVELQGCSDGHHRLAGDGVLAAEYLDAAALQRPCDLRGLGSRACGHALSGVIHPAVEIQELQLDAGAVEAGGVQRGVAVVLAVAAHAVRVEVVGAGLGLGFQRGAGGAVVVVGHGGRGQNGRQHQYQDHRPHAVEDPALAQTLYPQTLLHGPSPPCCGAIRRPTCSHSPIRC